jgi:hypothetical protein
MRLEVRRANLDDDLRTLFEQYGEQVVAMALALGSNRGAGLRTHPVAPTHAMNVVHANQDAAARWLFERRDLAERRETIALIAEKVWPLNLSSGHTNEFDEVELRGSSNRGRRPGALERTAAILR